MAKTIATKGKVGRPKTLPKSPLELQQQARDSMKRTQERQLGRDGMDITNVCEQVDAIAQAHLKGVQERLGRLRSMERELKRMVHECCGGKVAECRIIDVLTDHSKCLTESHPKAKTSRSK